MYIVSARVAGSRASSRGSRSCPGARPCCRRRSSPTAPAEPSFGSGGGGGGRAGDRRQRAARPARRRRRERVRTPRHDSVATGVARRRACAMRWNTRYGRQIAAAAAGAAGAARQRRRRTAPAPRRASRRSRRAASSCAATTCSSWSRRAAPPTARASLALPKGHLDGDETEEQAAAREVREEGGVDADLVEPLGDVRYHYRRDGRLVSKRVRFFLFRVPLRARRPTTITRSRTPAGCRSSRPSAS